MRERERIERVRDRGRVRNRERERENNKIHCSLERRPLITLYHVYCKLGKTIEAMHCLIQHASLFPNLAVGRKIVKS